MQRHALRLSPGSKVWEGHQHISLWAGHRKLQVAAVGAAAARQRLRRVLAEALELQAGGRDVGAEKHKVGASCSKPKRQDLVQLTCSR